MGWVGAFGFLALLALLARLLVCWLACLGWVWWGLVGDWWGGVGNFPRVDTMWAWVNALDGGCGDEGVSWAGFVCAGVSG